MNTHKKHESNIWKLNHKSRHMITVKIKGIKLVKYSKWIFKLQKLKIYLLRAWFKIPFDVESKCLI